MVGYVLLIVIAIGLSVAVFTYLRLYLPDEEPKCQDDVFITIESVECGGGEVNITLMNRGLFNIDGTFVRMGNVSRIAKTTLSERHGHRFLPDTVNGDGILSPGEVWIKTYDKNDYVGFSMSDLQEIEVEPFVFVGNKPALCEKAVVSRQIDCG